MCGVQQVEGLRIDTQGCSGGWRMRCGDLPSRILPPGADQRISVGRTMRHRSTAKAALLLLITLQHRGASSGGELLGSGVHLTPAAARPPNELWCYRCAAADADDRCADLRHNHSALIHKCSNDRRLCMVKRFSYTTSNENSTSTLKMWSLERNCTKHCEAGCIVIGERTKLYACTSCCTTSLCNSGSGAETTAPIVSTNFMRSLAILAALANFKGAYL